MVRPPLAASAALAGSSQVAQRATLHRACVIACIDGFRMRTGAAVCKAIVRRLVERELQAAQRAIGELPQCCERLTPKGRLHRRAGETIRYIY